MAFVEIKPLSKGRAAIDRRSITTLNINKQGDAQGQASQRYQMAIRPSLELMKAMRWQIGDRVSVLVDNSDPRIFLLKRVTHGGYAISYGGGADGKKGSAPRIHITKPEHIPFKQGERYECDGFHEEGGGAVLMFELVGDRQLDL